ncbi:hypothetical protein JXA02_04195 [candidate division KSB1 bacterium]|nr:hypothetical protein [candidate division KSB1 bacterium]RQW09067.1 MAG: hypothetical protein EH222_04715 [candidate division KSB1 bacterium]
MRRSKIYGFCLGLLLLCSIAPRCSAERPEKDAGIAAQVEELESVVGDVAQSLAAQTKIEPVDYNDLKKMLPTQLRGFKQTDVKGERTSMLGLRLSQAEAEFEGKKDGRIKMSIIDFGSVKGIAGKAMLAWMSAEIDNESDDGYEKTTDYRGYKAYEKYSYEEQEGKLSVIVEERFLVNVEGSNTDMASIKRAMSGVDLKKLKKLKNFGVPKEI